MFDRLIESTNERRLARTWFFFAASSVTWSVVLAGVAIAGVFLADAKLDADFERISLVPISQPSPAAPRTPSPAPDQQREAAPSSTFVAIVRPSETVLPPRPPSPYSGPIVPGAINGGDPTATGPGLPDGTVPGGSGNGGDGPVVPVPTPPQPSNDVAKVTQSPPPARLKHIGIINGLATSRVEPPYPELARSANVQGAVVVSVTVSETGRVLEAHVISGHPMLRQVSVDAARRWKFSPTILNGTPTKVTGTITFNFRRT